MYLLVGPGMSSLVPGMWSRAEGMSNFVHEMLSLAQMAGMVMLRGRGQGPLLDYLPLLRGGSDLLLHRLEGHPRQATASTHEMIPEMLLPQEDPL